VSEKKVDSKSDASADEIDFESAYKELETLVVRMEKGDQTLEQSLQDFERGVGLLKSCNSQLNSAEQKIDILIKDSQGVLGTEPFEPNE
jgi:exodeoxyribonuclease VII small subunit